MADDLDVRFRHDWDLLGAFSAMPPDDETRVFKCLGCAYEAAEPELVWASRKVCGVARVKASDLARSDSRTGLKIIHDHEVHCWSNLQELLTVLDRFGRLGTTRVSDLPCLCSPVRFMKWRLEWAT